VIELKVEGAEELAHAFEELRDAFSAKKARTELLATLRDVLRSIFVPVARRMAPRSAVPKHRKRPTDPVHMAESIDARAVRSGADVTAGAGPGKLHFWARFQEFGTKRHAAHPFMRPAFSATAQAMLAEITKRFQERFERAVERARRAA